MNVDKHDALLSRLIKACADGDEPTCEDCFERGASVGRDVRGIGLSPLFAAACEGHSGCVRLLLTRPGINVDEGDQFGRTPLYAACVNGHLQCAWLLAMQGANMAIGGGPDGGSALHAAARADNSKIVDMLLQVVEEHRALLEVRDKEGDTALHLAVENHAMESTEAMLKKGADPNATDAQLRTPLHIACHHGNDEAVDLLLEARANISRRDSAGRTPLHWAAAAQHQECIDALLTADVDKVTIDAQDLQGVTPFHVACLNNNTSGMRALVENGADVNLLDNLRRGAMHAAAAFGSVSAAQYLADALSMHVDSHLDNGHRTPLHWAVFHNQSQMVSWLIDMGASFGVRDSPSGRTPLHWAARLGHSRTLKLLLQKTMHEVGGDAQGREAMHLAALGGHAEGVKALATEGAGVNVRDRKGVTPLLLATYRGHHEVVQLLMSLGANPSIRSQIGVLPVHVAALKGHQECLEALLGHLPNSGCEGEDYVDSSGRTPLHLAAWGGYLECMQLLEAKGIGKINQQDKKGRSPLHMSAFCGNQDCLEWLIDMNAEVNVVDCCGETPLFKSVMNGHLDCIQFLLEHGADPTIADTHQRTLLHAAGHSADLDCLEVVLKELGNAALEVEDDERRTPFHYAVCAGNTEILEFLLAQAADEEESEESEHKASPLISRRCSGDRTALLLAAYSGDVEIGEFLLEQNANIIERAVEGATPLMIAVSRGKRRFAEALVERLNEVGDLDTGLSAVDDRGRSALHWAAFYGGADCAALLLDFGAPPDLGDIQQHTALDFACHAGHLHIVKQLLTHDADVNLPSAHSRTPLHYACAGGHAPVVHALLQARANVNAADEDGRTPLLIAAHNGHPHLCTLLVTNKARINARDIYGCTALTYAGLNGDALVVARLLEDGASTMLKDRSGTLPAEWASRKGHAHCQELLEGRKQSFSYAAMAKVLYDFTARDDTEVSITVGNVLKVLWRHESGWWKGELNGRVGLFPSNYCEVIEETPQMVVSPEDDSIEAGENLEDRGVCKVSEDLESKSGILVEAETEDKEAALFKVVDAKDISQEDERAVGADSPDVAAELREGQVETPVKSEDRSKAEDTSRGDEASVVEVTSSDKERPMESKAEVEGIKIVEPEPELGPDATLPGSPNVEAEKPDGRIDEEAAVAKEEPLNAAGESEKEIETTAVEIPGEMWSAVEQAAKQVVESMLDEVVKHADEKAVEAMVEAPAGIEPVEPSDDRPGAERTDNTAAVKEVAEDILDGVLKKVVHEITVDEHGVHRKVPAKDTTAGTREEARPGSRRPATASARQTASHLSGRKPPAGKDVSQLPGYMRPRTGSKEVSRQPPPVLPGQTTPSREAARPRLATPPVRDVRPPMRPGTPIPPKNSLSRTQPTPGSTPRPNRTLIRTTGAISEELGRLHEEFLRKKQTLNARREAVRLEREARELAFCTWRPRLSRGTIEMTAGRDRTQVFSRLYNDATRRTKFRAKAGEEPTSRRRR